MNIFMHKHRFAIIYSVSIFISIAVLLFFCLKTPNLSTNNHDETAMRFLFLYVIMSLIALILFLFKRKKQYTVLLTIGLVSAGLLYFPASYLSSCDRHIEEIHTNYWSHLTKD